MVRNITPLSKLAPKYLGPYKVVRKSKGDSYVLSDAIGNLLKRHFPPDQLKQAFNQELTAEFLVEKLIDFKSENDKDYFKARWFGYL